ncbi:MAG: hypothetical protein DRN81_05355 [Thermoproteota archaeon]|nr:MAG: hypothetical protein DRN81_05355 [Candidatus Korarchaeota archaeon]
MDVLTLLYMVIALFIALWVVIVLFLKYWLDIKRFAPEAKVFREARKKKLAILEITDSAGRTAFKLGTKRKRSDVHFSGSEYGIQIDPKLQGNAPENRTVDGVPIHHFSTQYPFPLSDKNARALETIVEHARENYPDLGFLSDADIIILAGTPRENLDHDVNNYIMEYAPEVEREVLTKQFALNTKVSSPFTLSYDVVAELNQHGIEIGYKSVSKGDLVKYLNSLFDELNLKLKRVTFSFSKDKTALNVIDKKTKEVKASLKRGDNNVCSLSIPGVLNNPGVEIGIIDSDGAVSVPDAELIRSDDNEYTLKTKDNDKYAILKEEDSNEWAVYKLSKTKVKLTKDDVVEQISQLQKEIQTLPVKHGFFSYTYAFNNSPMGMLAQDMQQLTLLIQRMAREEMKNEWERYVPLAFGVLIIIVGIIALVIVLGGRGGA